MDYFVHHFPDESDEIQSAYVEKTCVALSSLSGQHTRQILNRA